MPGHAKTGRTVPATSARRSTVAPDRLSSQAIRRMTVHRIFSVSALRAAEVAPDVARKTGLRPGRALTNALAEFAGRRKHAPGARTKNGLYLLALRELDRLEFAMPETSVAWRAKQLVGSTWDHKAAIVQFVKSGLSDSASATTLSPRKFDQAVARAFLACKNSSNPANACIQLLEDKARM